MINILLYIGGEDVHFYNRALSRLQSMYEGVQVKTVGWVGDKSYNIQISGGRCPWIELKNVNQVEFDFLVITGGYKVNFAKLSSKLMQVGVPAEKIVLDRTICVPGFTFKKLWALRNSNLTIFAKNCFGGYVYHQMGLPFRTPFINMFEETNGFLRFLKSPHQYLQEPLKFKKWSQQNGDDYPVFMLGDLEIHMNHYHDIEEAEIKFAARKDRINWSNFLVEALLQDREQIKTFLGLPYIKKVCFSPFDIDHPSVYFMDMERLELKKHIATSKECQNYTDSQKLDWTILRFAEGKWHFYDLFDMLLYGKKTPVNNTIFNF